MDQCKSYSILSVCLILLVLLEIKAVPLLNISTEENEKLVLRRELDAMTQELLTARDPDYPLYHSYIFKSGVGNREELHVESLKQIQFDAGEGVIAWQSVQSYGDIYLLGRKLNSFSLLTTPAQLSTNKAANLSEQSLEVAGNILSTLLYTIWNPAEFQQEVFVVVATDNPSADILWFKVKNGKLEHIGEWARYRKTSSMAVVNDGRKNQLVIVDTEASASVDVVDVMYSGSQLTFKVVQTFSLHSACSLVLPCRVGRQIYLVFLLPRIHYVTVYYFRPLTNTINLQHHSNLVLPLVSQVITFNVANQVYLAVNGFQAYVFRITPSGQFIVEHTEEYVKEWLSVPVFSYRSDVALFSKYNNLTISLHVWAGLNKGFKTIQMPECDGCLEGDWSGAVSVSFQHEHSILLPQAPSSSSLVTITTSLQDTMNPVLEQINSLDKSIKYYKIMWQEIKSNISRIEETLKYAINKDGKNVITAKWKLNKLETPVLNMDNMVKAKSELNSTRNILDDGKPIDVDTLMRQAEDTINDAKYIITVVDQKEKEVWGLQGFTGKIKFNGGLTIDNLTISSLNNHSVNQLLQNTFRKDKPQTIRGEIIVTSLNAENIIVDQVNNSTQDHLKFSDSPVTIKGNMTFLSPLTVDGDVELVDGGRVNGVDLSEMFCRGEERCSVVLPVLCEEENTIGKDTVVDTNHTWSLVFGGKNLTVLKVNGVDWNTLVENVVYKDTYQNVDGTVFVKGTLHSLPAMWARSVEEVNTPELREPETTPTSPLLEIPQPRKKSQASNRMQLEDMLRSDSNSDMIFTELEVTGTVTCIDSVWGASAADVVLSSANPIKINAVKHFDSNVSVANNLEVKGSIGGVNLSELLTTDTHQIFDGPTTLHGNITLGNVTVTGLWNGANISNSSANPSFLTKDEPVYMDNVIADSVKVLETLNGIAVSELVFTNNNGITTVRKLSAASLHVIEDMNIVGQVCGQELNEFNKKRLSIKEEQNVTGNVLINKATVSSDFKVDKFNNVDMSIFMNDLENLSNSSEVHLSELYIRGNITTDLGINGFNLTDIAANAIWLQSNNDVKGHLTFKDEVTFGFLECQGFCNQKPCHHWLDASDVVYKTNKTVILTGNMTFLNPLNIAGDLHVEEINGHKAGDILTKTSEQEIKGDIFISGDVIIDQELTLIGLLNNQNMSKFAESCTLSDNTIRCKGNAVFNKTVDVEHFNSTGRINGIDFDHFVESLVDLHNPQHITGFKNFVGNTTTKHLEVSMINSHSWDDFLLDAVVQNAHEEVEWPVVFMDKVVVDKLSVNKDLDADSVNDLDLNEWRTNAIYINESFTLKRPLHLRSASSKSNLNVITYDDVNLNLDLIMLNDLTTVDSLKFKSVTVTEEVVIANTVNGHLLVTLEKNTLKISGDHTVTSDFVFMGDVSVSGNITTTGQVNHHDLREVVSLTTNQTLDGNYHFECVEGLHNMSVSGLMSGVNMTEWMETAVLKGSDQEIHGVWSVLGDLELKGPVTGRGRLADIDLKELKDNITRDILDVHQAMKANLSFACDEANHHLATARNQTIEMLYIDVSQEITVPAGISLVTHFKVEDENYLSVSETGCTTTFYKWDNFSETFSRLYSEMLGLSVSQLVILQHKNHTYVLTVSPVMHSDCYYTGKQLWVFTEDRLTHISPVDNVVGDMLESYGNTLYSMYGTKVFKWELQIADGIAYFSSTEKWRIDTTGKNFVPKNAGLGLALQDSTEIVSLESDFNVIPEMYSNCTGEIHSFSVDPTGYFIAVATTERTEVPRYSDHVKVYQQNGRLFDKLPAQQASHIEWLAIPQQTWLVFLQNHSSIHLYHLQDGLKGFQLKLSAKMEAIDLLSLSLPLASKVNPQPYLIVQTQSSVKILQTVLQGDPYLGSDLHCCFDDDLFTVLHDCDMP